MTPLLEVCDLVKDFPVKGKAIVHAVSGASFSIAPGETLALVGESGSGKTTTGRCILGLEQPTSGTILFRGTDISSMSGRDHRRMRPKIQWVSQNPFDSLDPRQRIGEIIAEPVKLVFGLRGSELDKRVGNLATMVGLSSDTLSQFPYELGGGYQQRVAIARSFATQPDLIVLDEPTSALDTLARADIIELLINLQRETSVSYLFISHDLLTVQAISSRIVVMYLGKVAELGPTDQVFATPRHPYTRALLASVLVADPKASEGTFTLSGEIPSPINLPPGCPLASRCPLAIPQCSLAVPPLRSITDRHWAACIRIDVNGDGYLEPISADTIDLRTGGSDIQRGTPITRSTSGG